MPTIQIPILYVLAERQKESATAVLCNWSIPSNIVSMTYQSLHNKIVPYDAPYSTNIKGPSFSSRECL